MNEFERLLGERIDRDLARRIAQHSCPTCDVLYLHDSLGREWCPLCGHRP